MNAKNTLIAIVMVFVITALVISVFNRGYGVVDYRSYEFATALYSACNRQDDAGVEKLKTMLAHALDRDELPAHEAKWLQDMIDQAQSGGWKAAARSCRRMLADQIKPASLPRLE